MPFLAEINTSSPLLCKEFLLGACVFSTVPLRSVNSHKTTSHAEWNNWRCLVLDHLFASSNECHCFKEMIDTLKEQEKTWNSNQQGILFREQKHKRSPSPLPCRHAQFPPTPTYELITVETTLRAQPFHLQMVPNIRMSVTLRTRSQLLSWVCH